MLPIEVDEEVYSFLKKYSTFEDTPNSVIRRLLRLKGNKIIPESNEDRIFPDFSASTPKALIEIIQMMCLVKKKGYTREGATRLVADLNSIAIPTVQDKYCRQLHKNAHEIDELLADENLEGFRNILIQKFPSHIELINEIFPKLIS